MIRYEYSSLSAVVLLFVLLCACSTERQISKTINIQAMDTINIKTDTFPIEEYNRYKDEFGVYKKTQGDSLIMLSYDKVRYTYYKSIEREQDYFYTIYLYYATGKIKEYGQVYSKNDSGFFIGIRRYYDEQGNVTKTVDYDTQARINYKKALEIVKERFGYNPQDLYLYDADGSWYIKCVSGKYKGKGAWVDKTTGKAEKIEKVKVFT